MKALLNRVVARLSGFLPDKSIEASKAEWNALAGENHKYYIVSKKGKAISDEDFRKTGEENYNDIIIGDNILTERLGSYADKRVLDIGCGAGRLVEFFARDFARVDGVDISEKMVEEGRKRLTHLKNVAFASGDGMHYPYPDNTFDLVFSYIVFQHMPSVEVIKENFKEVRRVLKPSGIAKIQIRGNTPVRKGTWFYGPSFTESDARVLMDEVGLTIVKMSDDSIKRFFLWLTK